MSTSPNTDMIQEMRVESTNFTASIGHGTGVGITMMTKAGTNTPRGTLNHQYWTNKFNPPNRFQDIVFDNDPRARGAYEDGYSHNLSTTFGGPVQIPGHQRHQQAVHVRQLFLRTRRFQREVSRQPDTSEERSGTQPPGRRLFRPAAPAESCSVRDLRSALDETGSGRPGHVIRTPFPNNIIPADRIVNPLYNLYKGILPNPNQNPTASNQQPINNFYDVAQPDPLRSHVYGVRMDFNHSDKTRFFGRVSGSHFTEGAGD